MLKDSSGRYTQQNITRCGQLSGAMGRALDRSFAHKVCDTYLVGSHTEKKKEAEQEELVRDFIEIYKPDKLVQFTPKRSHKDFDKFEYSMEVRNAEKFKERLQQHSNRLDELLESYPIHEEFVYSDEEGNSSMNDDMLWENQLDSSMDIDNDF